MMTKYYPPGFEIKTRKPGTVKPSYLWLRNSTTQELIDYHSSIADRLADKRVHLPEDIPALTALRAAVNRELTRRLEETI